MTDIGFTDGGLSKGVSMFYLAGKMDHANMVDHIARLMEKKVAEMDAQKAAAEARDPIPAQIAAE